MKVAFPSFLLEVNFQRLTLDWTLDCGFDFAIFNYADVMIDLGVAIILLQTFLESRKEKK